MLGRVFNFGGAVEGKGCGHENHDRPVFAVRPVFFGHFNEFSIMEGVDFEGLHFGVDQACAHGKAPLRVVMNKQCEHRASFNESIADD
jgi:hypothetical protein